MKSALYIGAIAHQRFTPKVHRFRYPFFMWLLNLEEVDQLPSLGRWFSTTRWAMSRFCRSDYLGDPRQPLHQTIKARMEELTGHPVAGQVCGLLNLRTLGIYFSPVNFYYGFTEEGHCSHFLAEVSNIPWNERHQYAHYLLHGDLAPSHPKSFHVSPFNPMNQSYQWQISPPGEHIGVQLAVKDHRGRVFEASLQLDRRPLTIQSVRKQLLRNPAMTAYIVSGIYWQALKLYLKGVPYIAYEKEAS